uniref:Uncharacterized protein n=1 Tax=Dicentrarchus labrax TaxID=13489 RepID=A0A8P4G365_DICLA
MDLGCLWEYQIWALALFPWYGVTFLAEHIDNITYTLQGFANETIRGFEYLSNTQRSHRLTLLKHDMALDYILAKQGGLCVALNLTGDACYTLIPDSSDNITSVIDALRNIRDVHWKVRWVDQPDFGHCFDFIS